MAGEIGHVVYAARLLTYLGDAVKTPDYWVGTLFPDIRHLGVVSRRQTHTEDVTLSSLIGENDFYTGMRVHAWVDMTREKFLREQNVKETLPWHPFVPHALKLMEDEILYDHFDDWNLIHRTLSNVHEGELHYVDDRSKIIEWHTVLQKYFSQKPSDESRVELSLGIGLSKQSAGEINNVLQLLRNDKRTPVLINSFLEHLENILR